jgi:hypothetical protein
VLDIGRLVKRFRKAFTGVQPRTYFIDARTFGSDYLLVLSAESILKCVPRGQHKYFEEFGSVLGHREIYQILWEYKLLPEGYLEHDRLLPGGAWLFEPPPQRRSLSAVLAGLGGYTKSAPSPSREAGGRSL